MGYEVKMFIVTHRKFCNDGWCSVLGMIDLSKPGYDREVYKIIQKYSKLQKNLTKEKKYFFYNYYCNKEFKVKEDEYGDNLILIPIREFLDALRKNNEHEKELGCTYRRFDIAIHLLESIIGCKGFEAELEEIFVLIYGH